LLTQASRVDLMHNDREECSMVYKKLFDLRFNIGADLALNDT